MGLASLRSRRSSKAPFRAQGLQMFDCGMSGARGRMSLFPPEAEATAFTTLDQLRQWYGLAAEPWQAFHLQVGQPDVRIFSALPAEALVENIMLTRVGVAAASLSPAHAVQIGLVWRLANRIIHTEAGGITTVGGMWTLGPSQLLLPRRHWSPHRLP